MTATITRIHAGAIPDRKLDALIERLMNAQRDFTVEFVKVCHEIAAHPRYHPKLDRLEQIVDVSERLAVCAWELAERGP